MKRTRTWREAHFSGEFWEAAKKQRPPSVGFCKFVTAKEKFQICGQDKNLCQTPKNIAVHNLDPVANLTPFSKKNRRKMPENAHPYGFWHLAWCVMTQGGLAFLKHTILELVCFEKGELAV